MTIIPFPVSPEHAIALIREAVENGRVTIPDPPNGGEWYRVVTHRQANSCLREGDLIEGPETDEFGNLRCVMERFGAGQLVRVHVALMKEDTETSWRVIVTNVENRI